MDYQFIKKLFCIENQKKECYIRSFEINLFDIMTNVFCLFVIIKLRFYDIIMYSTFETITLLLHNRVKVIGENNKIYIGYLYLQAKYIIT